MRHKLALLIVLQITLRPGHSTQNVKIGGTHNFYEKEFPLQSNEFQSLFLGYNFSKTLNYGFNIDGMYGFCPVCDEAIGYTYYFSPSIIFGKSQSIQFIQIDGFVGLGYIFASETIKIERFDHIKKKISEVNIPIITDFIFNYRIGKVNLGTGVGFRANFNSVKNIYGIRVPLSIRF